MRMSQHKMVTFVNGNVLRVADPSVVEGLAERVRT
jgi:hypothetical protein